MSLFIRLLILGISQLCNRAFTGRLVFARIVHLGFWGVLGVSIPLQGSSLSFPAGSGLVIDVTEHGVTPNDGSDDTAAIQALVDTYKGNAQGAYPRILYFPNGTYHLSDSIVGTLLDGGSGFGWIIIQGESEQGTILKLADNAAGFDNPQSPKPLLLYFGGDWSNNVFGNALENITVDVGSGNPGATAVAFFCNNYGWIRNVTLRTSGASPEGAIGLDLGYRGPNGIGLIEGLSVEGFEVGISNVGHSQMMPWVFDDIRLIGQGTVGLLQDLKPYSIRRLFSDNSVPAIRMTGAAGMMTILDSEFVGGAPDTPAVVIDESMDHNEKRMRSGAVLIRNVKHSGYAAALKVNGELITGDFSNSSYRTQQDSAGLWANRPDDFLNLEVPDYPTVPVGASADWHVVDPIGLIDHTELLRTAMNSGAETIVLKPGAYQISDTIRLGRDVRLVMGQMALITLTTAFALQEKPVFLIEESRHPAVHIQKLYSNWGGQGDSTTRAWGFHNASTSDLVLQDIFWPMGPFFRNDPLAKGNVFMKNIHSLPGGQNNPRTDISAFEFDYQRVWGWQINPEMFMPHIINRGSDLWLFGFKFGEREGPFIKASRHGRTEILTGGMNMTDEHVPSNSDTVALIEVEDATVTGMFVERASYEPASGVNGWGFHHVVLRETRNGVQRQITHTADGTDISNFTNHQFSDPTIYRRPSNKTFLNTFGAYIGFLAAGYDSDTPNQKPVVSVTAPEFHTFGSALSLEGVAEDTDGGPGPLIYFWSKASGPGRVLFDDFEALTTQANFSQPGRYVLRLTARDGVDEVFAEKEVYVVLDSAVVLYPITDATTVDNLKDGEGDSLAGDGNSSYGQVATYRRFVMSFDIRPFIDYSQSIQTATLRLTTMGHNGGSGNVHVYYNTIGQGRMNNGDYQTVSNYVNAFSGPYADGTTKSVDITHELKTAIENNRHFIEIRLDRNAAASEWDWVRFYGRVEANELYRPQIEIIPAEPPAANSVMAALRGTEQVWLSWDSTSENVSDFKIERAVNGGDYSLLGYALGTATHYVDDSISLGATYRYRITAQNAVGSSEGVESNLLNTTGAVEAPQASGVKVNGRVAVGNPVSGYYIYSDTGEHAESGSSFRWLISSQAEGPFYPISGAVDLNYEPTQNAFGQFIKFEVTPASTATQGMPTLSSAYRIERTLVAPQAMRPRIDGLALVGTTLVGDYDYYDANGDSAGTPVYRWLMSEEPYSGYSPIVGTTSRELLLTAENLNRYLVFEVTPVSLASPTTSLPVRSAPVYMPSAGKAAFSINFHNGGVSYQVEETTPLGPASVSHWNNLNPGTNTIRYKSFQSSTGLPQGGGLTLHVNGERLPAILEQESPANEFQSLGYGYLFYNAQGEAFTLENIGSAFDLSHGYTLYLITGNTSGSARTYQYTLSNNETASTTGTMGSYTNWVEGTNYVKFTDLTDDTLSISVNSPNFNKVGIAGIQIIGVPIQGGQMSNASPYASEVATTGSAQVGMTMQGNYSFQDPNNLHESGSLYRWLIGSTADGYYEPVEGATGLTFTPESHHANHYLVFEVIPRNTLGRVGNSLSSPPVLVLSSEDAETIAVSVNFYGGNSAYSIATNSFVGPAKNPLFSGWNNLASTIPNGSVTTLKDSDGVLRDGVTLTTTNALRNRENGTTETEVQTIGYGYLEWNANTQSALTLSGLGTVFDLNQTYTVYFILGTDSVGERTLAVTCIPAAESKSMTASLASFDSWTQGVNYLKFPDMTSDTLSFDLSSPFFNKIGIGGIQIVGKKAGVSLSPFQQWQNIHFGDINLSEAQLNEDPDDDGIINLLEYALGGDPLAANSVSMPQLEIMGENEHNYLKLTVNKNADAADLTYIVEVSADLSTWGSTEGVDVVTITNTDGTLEVRDAVPISAVSPRRFMRLRVTR